MLVLGLRLVKRFPPTGIVLHVIVGGDEATSCRAVHVRGAVLSGQSDRGAILSGKSDHFRLRICIDQFVAHRGDFDVEGRSAGVLRSFFVEIFGPCVFGGIKSFAGLLVDPIVAHHTMLVWVCARQKRGMADTRISGRVAVMVVAVPATFIEQKFEAAVAVEIVILDQLVLGKAVDHQKQH